MPKYRKKSLVIDAEITEEVKVIQTLEGDMIASPGDWIITGINGEQYPCKPDIFKKSYDLVRPTRTKCYVTLINGTVDTHEDERIDVKIHSTGALKLLVKNKVLMVYGAKGWLSVKKTEYEV